MGIGTAVFKGRNRGAVMAPLRTLKELAEEFGLRPQHFGQLLKKYGGPKPVFKFNTIRSPYYKPKEVRDWWASLPADVRKPQ